MITSHQKLVLDGPIELAFELTDGEQPTIVFLCGLRSDMNGAKATFLAEHCRRAGRRFVRFDYRGHGRSSGQFEDHCLSDWLADTLVVLDRLVPGAFVLVGSSMGGWLALLAGVARPSRMVGMIGVASAPDFTIRLIEPHLTLEIWNSLERDGVIYAPYGYGEPLPITKRLIEDGRRHQLLNGPILLECPIHLLHGQLDPNVPWQTALDLAARLESDAVTVELIKDGDHRLGREDDLKRLGLALDRIVALISR